MRIDADVKLSSGRVRPGADWRLESAVEDIQALRKRGAVVVLCGHLGRPGGVVDETRRVKPVSAWFSRRLNTKVRIASGVVGPEVRSVIEQASPGDVVALENVRFDPRERKNSRVFGRELASLADVYVNNAFGNCHRKHASMHAVTRYLPSYAGSALVDEVRMLSKRRSRPFVVVMGGVKFETKMPALERMAQEADVVLVGGGLALALLQASAGLDLTLDGKHKIAREDVRSAQRALKHFGHKILMPMDMVVSKDGSLKRARHVNVMDLKRADRIVDIGEQTMSAYAKVLRSAKSAIWNGPMGIVEERAGQAGTLAIEKALARVPKSHTVIGGGDTITFLRKKKLGKHFSLLSNGGGSLLVFLADGPMPGLEVLKK